MQNELLQKIAAVRAASEIGCFGAHQVPGGEWMPCSSTKQFLSLTMAENVKSRILIDDMRQWSSIRKAKGKKRKKRWEKLRERRILGIDTLEGGGLVSGNSPTSANVVSGGNMPPITYGSTVAPSMSTKTIQPSYMPRDNDQDVFIDIESARRRAQQLGCIGVSRRMSKGGKTVWMPCTNLTDYNNLTATTSLGRLNQAKRNDRVVRTIVREELKKRKKSISEEILGKSLGPKLRGIGRAATSRFDPKAIDGDEDGMLQDGTPFERPNVPRPSIPSEPTRTRPSAREKENIDESSISAVGRWVSKLTPKEKEDFRSEPIDAYDGPDSRSGLASISGKPTSTPISIDKLKNPEASPTNPFRNLGGKIMGKLIRGMVKPEHKNKQDRITFIVGGNTGSGKSTVLDAHLIPQGLVPSESEAAVIDPDFIKKGLSGYNDGDGAGTVHGESQSSADKTIVDSAADGMDIVLMGSGASRQLKHMREAKSRGESVVGHWVHVPQRVASSRIKKRTEETGRYIPDNTAHMAASIPKSVSTAFNEDLLDEFYLWDNDVPEGAAPRLVAKKVKGNEFEIFDQPKFEEFAGDKKWADRWVETANENEGGLASAGYSGSEAVGALKDAGFEVDVSKNIEVRLPSGSEAEKFFRERVQPLMTNKFGRTNTHASRLSLPGIPIVEDVQKLLGVNIDKKLITDKKYRKQFRARLLSSDPKVLAELFSRAPIVGPRGESRFGDLIVGDVGIEIGGITIEQIAKKTGFSEREISMLISEGFSEAEIAKMPEEEIKELLDTLRE